MSQINFLAEDQPGSKQKLQTFRVKFKNDGELDVRGFGLRVDSGTYQILGEKDIIAAFSESEIIGIWPVEESSST